ncbi:MAG: hypothetical protein HLUCCA12_12120 [Rhodobacteraceae bacterium HLUCCA12]|nr:MAG: hypothetical protein HLUCCA12_12120 [Rhodobacteraceae bacterium HLUCCA12]
MGLSIRGYAQHRAAQGLPGTSHTAVRKAIASGRITPESDGTIDPVLADAQWAGQTDPAMQRGAEAHAQALEARQAAMQEAVEDDGPAPRSEAGDGPNNYARAKFNREVLQGHLLSERLKREKKIVVNRAKAIALFFDMARKERDAWVGWPARVSANMAAELGVDAHTMEHVLDHYLREHLEIIAEVKIELR